MHIACNRFTPVGPSQWGAAGADRARCGTGSPACLGWPPLRELRVCVCASLLLAAQEGPVSRDLSNAVGPSCAQPAPRRLRQTGIFISTRNQWRDSARELHDNPDATFAGVCVPLRILPPRCAQWPPHLRRLGTQPDGRPLSATSEPVRNPPGPLCPAAGTAHPGERALRCRSQSPVGDTVPICMRKQSQEQGAWSHTPREPPRAGATARPCRIDFDRPV